MRSREISLWIDERWYDALEKHLAKDSVEDVLNDHLDELLNQLPENVYERISTEIQQEELEAAREREATTKYAVFHIAEHGKEQCFQISRGLEFMDTARLLRAYLRGERGANAFSQMLYQAKEITPAEFEKMVALRMENTGKVTGAFRLDFDLHQIATLHIMDGWQAFNMQDVSVAVYRADRKQYLSSEQRWELFLDKLDGKALTTESVEQNNYLKGSQRLRPEEIRFEDEIQWNGHLLEFYVPVYFDPDKVFGTEIATSGRDDYVNVYADYDLETQSVSEALTVILYRCDGSEDEFRYKLTEGEQEMFREKMNEYAVQSTSMDLSDWHEQYLMEIGREMIHGGSSLEIQII